MSETASVYITCSDQLVVTMNRICSLIDRGVLKAGHVELLLGGLVEVADGTGFGGVELVLANGRVQNVKTIKSARPEE